MVLDYIVHVIFGIQVKKNDLHLFYRLLPPSERKKLRSLDDDKKNDVIYDRLKDGHLELTSGYSLALFNGISGTYNSALFLYKDDKTTGIDKAGYLDIISFDLPLVEDVEAFDNFIQEMGFRGEARQHLFYEVF